MGSYKGTSEVPATPVIHKFGDEELSDVTFIVGGEHFMCHKMTLASRSSYFKAMFFSGFKEKDQNKVTVVADPAVFGQLMEILYTGNISYWKDVLSCHEEIPTNRDYVPPHLRNPMPVMNRLSDLWKKCSSLLNLADQFDVLKRTVTALETFFLRRDFDLRHGDECKCGVKFVIAVTYGMKEYKEKCTATRGAVVNALRAIKTVQPNFIDPLFEFDEIQKPAWLR